MFVTLRSNSSDIFLDSLLQIYFKKSKEFIKHFILFKKKLEEYTSTNSTKLTFLLPFKNGLSILKCLSNTLNFNFSFHFFLNLLDFPLFFNYFNILNTLLNIKIYIIIKSSIKEHSLFFLKLLNLIS